MSPGACAKIKAMATLKERVDRHDREIAAIRKLIHAGMKLLVKFEENQLLLREEHIAFRKEFRELQAQQRETSRELQAFIRSLRRGGNGHTRGRSDVQ
jgi:predicted  nucleic acid-binding Zn-ribbon protein